MKKLSHKQCTVLASSNTVFFDVDDTLIMWGRTHRAGRSDVVRVEDPFLRESMTFVPHVSHINILKRNHAQGRQVVVWSAAGHQWAQAVVEMLGLTPYVTLIMGKPTLYVDDKPMEQWAPQRIYLQHDVEGEQEDVQ